MDKPILNFIIWLMRLFTVMLLIRISNNIDRLSVRQGEMERNLEEFVWLVKTADAEVPEGMGQ